jgi:hypothetical protein
MLAELIPYQLGDHRPHKGEGRLIAVASQAFEKPIVVEWSRGIPERVG